MLKNELHRKELVLNRETVSNLTLKQLDRSLAGKEVVFRCFRNLWTLYYCDVINSRIEPDAGMDELDIPVMPKNDM
jgi:hypothetical protein